jgi:hypothetical protein
MIPLSIRYLNFQSSTLVGHPAPVGLPQAYLLPTFLVLLSHFVNSYVKMILILLNGWIQQ